MAAARDHWAKQATTNIDRNGSHNKHDNNQQDADEEPIAIFCRGSFDCAVHWREGHADDIAAIIGLLWLTEGEAALVPHPKKA